MDIVMGLMKGFVGLVLFSVVMVSILVMGFVMMVMLG